MGWELLDGDPAPGSVDAVHDAARAFLQVAELASGAAGDLRSGTASLGLGYWKGSAAETFRSGVQELPRRLDEVDRSYRSAHHALTTFGRTLEREQHEARAALAAAEQAAADRAAAGRRLDAARMERDSLRSQRIGAEARHLTLQGQRSVTLEPAQRAALDRSVASARSRVDRLRADGQAADAAVSRHESDVRAAEHRLRQAEERARRVRERLSGAVDDAVRGLQTAEQAGNLPDYAERLWTDTKETAGEWAAAAREAIPRIVQVLDVAQTVLSLLALLPTPLAPAFAAVALTCGVSALVLSLAASATQPGGMRGADWADLGVRMLSVGASGALFKGTKAAASGAHTAAKGAFSWSRRLQDASGVAEIGREYVEHGEEAAVTAAGVFLVGKGVAHGSAKALQKSAAQANKSPAVQQRLEQMSRGIRERADNPTGHRFLVPTAPQAQAIQSFLGTGPIRPGGALPGHHGLTDPLSHSLKGSELQDVLTEGIDAGWRVMEKVPDGPVEGAKVGLRENIDIDIDIDPGPFRGQR